MKTNGLLNINQTAAITWEKAFLLSEGYQENFESTENSVNAASLLFWYMLEEHYEDQSTEN